MASKGQKFKKYTAEFRQKVLEEYFNGEGGPTALAEKHDISYHTIRTWIDKTNHPERFPGLGRKPGRPKDSEIDWKERYEILKKYQAFLKAQRERK
ncbi:MAG: helix-turn-helix domain-containing protein [Erysipelotrichaceae bacterium]|nr:helix-turn-helix domain-containing protein [Erysipelotrichaceae bacterium]